MGNISFKLLKPQQLNLEKSSCLKNSLLEVLKECSDEFLPPLSQRSGTRQTDFAQDNQDGIDDYFNNLLDQHNLIVVENGQTISFMSFIHNYKNEIFNKFDDGINNYVSTICTSVKHRGKGLVKALYDKIESELPRGLMGKFVSTRTWSTNDSHIAILNKRGYMLIHRVENDRTMPDGTKVDTVYFAKRRQHDNQCPTY